MFLLTSGNQKLTILNNDFSLQFWIKARPAGNYDALILNMSDKLTIKRVA